MADKNYSVEIDFDVDGAEAALAQVAAVDAAVDRMNKKTVTSNKNLARSNQILENSYLRISSRMKGLGSVNDSISRSITGVSTSTRGLNTAFTGLRTQRTVTGLGGVAIGLGGVAIAGAEVSSGLKQVGNDFDGLTRPVKNAGSTAGGFFSQVRTNWVNSLNRFDRSFDHTTDLIRNFRPLLNAIQRTQVGFFFTTLAGAILGLVAPAFQAVNAIWAIPAAIAGVAGVALGLWAIFSGIGTAMKAMTSANKAMAASAAKDLGSLASFDQINVLQDTSSSSPAAINALSDAMGKLSANGQAVALALYDIGQQFKQNVQLPAQQKALEGVAGALRATYNELEPTLSGALLTVAGGVNTVLLALLQVARTQSFKNLITETGDLSNEMLLHLVPSFQPLIGILESLVKIGGPYILQFEDYLVGLIQRFDEFASSVSGEQKINEWIQNATLQFQLMGQVWGGVFKIIGDLYTISNSTGNLIETTLIGILNQFDAWLKSAQGTKVVTDLIELAATNLQGLADAFFTIMNFLEPVLTFFNDLPEPVKLAAVQFMVLASVGSSVGSFLGSWARGIGSLVGPLAIFVSTMSKGGGLVTASTNFAKTAVGIQTGATAIQAAQAPMAAAVPVSNQMSAFAKNMLGITGSIALIGVAVAAIASAFYIINATKVDVGSMIAFGVMVVLLGGAIAAITVFSPAITAALPAIAGVSVLALALSASFLLLGAATVMIATAAEKFNSISWEALGKMFIAVAVVMGLAVLAGLAAGLAIPGAIAISLAGAGLLLASLSLSAASNQKVDLSNLLALLPAALIALTATAAAGVVALLAIPGALAISVAGLGMKVAAQALAEASNQKVDTDKLNDLYVGIGGTMLAVSAAGLLAPLAMVGLVGIMLAVAGITTAANAMASVASKSSAITQFIGMTGQLVAGIQAMQTVANTFNQNKDLFSTIFGGAGQAVSAGLLAATLNSISSIVDSVANIQSKSAALTGMTSVASQLTAGIVSLQGVAELFNGNNSLWDAVFGNATGENQKKNSQSLADVLTNVSTIVDKVSDITTKISAIPSGQDAEAFTSHLTQIITDMQSVATYFSKEQKDIDDMTNRSKGSKSLADLLGDTASIVTDVVTINNQISGISMVSGHVAFVSQLIAVIKDMTEMSNVYSADKKVIDAMTNRVSGSKSLADILSNTSKIVTDVVGLSDSTSRLTMEKGKVTFTQKLIDLINNMAEVSSVYSGKNFNNITSRAKNSGSLADIIENVKAMVIDLNDIQGIAQNLNLSQVGKVLTTIGTQTLQGFINGAWTTQSQWWSLGDSIASAIAGGIRRNQGQITGALKSALGGYKITFTGNPGSGSATVTVAKFARGGVVDQPTLGVFGEAGREAIMPLENNTEWIGDLADQINERGSKAQPAVIILQIDGRELGRAAVENINSLSALKGVNLSIV